MPLSFTKRLVKGSSVTATENDANFTELENKCVLISDSQTLTNKTLTSPILNSPTINGATLTGTLSNGTFTGTTLTSPTINGATVTGTLSGGTYSGATLGNLSETIFTITDGVSVDLNPANGPIQSWTLGGNRTPTATNFAAGQSMLLRIDDGTANTITWTTIAPVWLGSTAGASGSAPTLGTTGWTWIEFFKISTTVYAVHIGYSAT